MFKKVTPFNYDPAAHREAGLTRPTADFYVPGDKVTLRLDTIREVRTDGATDAGGGSQLAKEVEHLTSAVRDLWQLLRARLY